MSGEDENTTCPKYKDFTDYVPDFLPLLSGNKLPTIIGDDDGIWRRWIFAPWDVQITEEQRDRQLRHKLTQPEVLAGIFNFALEGHRRYRQLGLLTVPPRMQQMVETYRRNACDVQQFVNDCCATTAQTGWDPNMLKSTVGTLYAVYRSRRARNYEPYLNIQYFSRRLDELGFPTDRKDKGGTRFKLGIMLQDEGCWKNTF
jgi:putative DNA primase/helicase